MLKARLIVGLGFIKEFFSFSITRESLVLSSLFVAAIVFLPYRLGELMYATGV